MHEIEICGNYLDWVNKYFNSSKELNPETIKSDYIWNMPVDYIYIKQNSLVKPKGALIFYNKVSDINEILEHIYQNVTIVGNNNLAVDMIKEVQKIKNNFIRDKCLNIIQHHNFSEEKYYLIIGDIARLYELKLSSIKDNIQSEKLSINIVNQIRDLPNNKELINNVNNIIINSSSINYLDKDNLLLYINTDENLCIGDYNNIKNNILEMLLKATKRTILEIIQKGE